MNKYEEEQYLAIKEWKKSDQNFFGKPLETADKVIKYVSMPIKLLTIPASKLFIKLIPTRVTEKAVKGANLMGEWLVDEKDVIRDGKVSSLEDLQTKGLKLSDKMANDVHNWAVGMAGTEGVITGAGGLFLIGADIIALTSFSFRTIHKIGMCYGYQLKEEEGEQLTLGVLSIAMADSKKEKAEILDMVEQLTSGAVEDTVEEIIGETIGQGVVGKQASGEFIARRGIFFSMKGVAQHLGVYIGRRKLLQLAPIVGAGIGGTLNCIHLNNVAWAARRVFQEKWLRDNGKI